MAQVKAHEVDRYLNQPKEIHKLFLIYGPDTGLVSERAQLLAKSSGVDLKDDFSTITIDADDAAADPNRIADEAHTVSMFGGKRLVWIKGSTQKNLAGALQPIIDVPPEDTIVIVEAGDLKKSSPLRSRIEKAASAIALPCYQDQDRAVEMVINQELSAHGLTMDAQAKCFLKSLLGSDRLASRGEVQKLCLYAGNAGSITIDDITAIVGDASALAVDTIIDAASLGDIATMEHTFKRLIAKGTAVFQIINAAQRHFQTLHLARGQMDTSGRSSTAVVGTMRPPVNFQRKDKISRALSIWQSQAIERTLKRLESVSLETRTNNDLAVPLASTALLAIAIEAKRQMRRA